jgi:hypothetical protein
LLKEGEGEKPSKENTDRIFFLPKILPISRKIKLFNNELFAFYHLRHDYLIIQNESNFPADFQLVKNHYKETKNSYYRNMRAETTKDIPSIVSIWIIWNVAWYTCQT